MHIPDGFLSPQTCAVCYAATAPFWYTAWQSLKKRFETTTAAHVGMAAAFVFLLQMFNVPIPGGTSGHAVGTAIVTIALGPAAAIIATSFALLLQALVFGDGGIWAYGANVLTMAVIPAWTTWGIWRIMGGAGNSRKKTNATAFAAGYLSAVTGALMTGLLLGLQPILHTTVGGTPLYFPLGLEVSIPAMVGSHLLLGFVEGGVTLGAIGALASLPDFQLAKPDARRGGGAIIGFTIAAMIFLVPLGIILPGLMNAGEPWGEWSPQETAKIAEQSEVPTGLAKYADGYAAPVPDYQFAESAGMAGESAQYIGAALLGVILVVLISLPMHRLQQRRLRNIRKRNPTTTS